MGLKNTHGVAPPFDSQKLSIMIWLVVDLPLWKIWKSVGIMTVPIYGKIKNGPNHQPVHDSCYFQLQRSSNLPQLGGSWWWHNASPQRLVTIKDEINGNKWLRDANKPALSSFTPIESFFDPFGTKKLRLDTIGDVLKRWTPKSLWVSRLK